MTTQSDLYVGEYPIDMTPAEAAEEIARQKRETYLCKAQIVAAELRSLRCVEAMEGIPDPAAFVQAARGMAEALEHLTTFTDDTCRYVDADPLIASAQSALTAFRAATVGEA